MPDRAIIALMPAIALGFICGLIVSVLQMQSGGAFIVALCGAVLVAIAGTSSVFGAKGEGTEKAAVGALRAVTAVALFACIFFFMRSFLGDGQPVVSLVWAVLAGVFGLLLAQLRVRERKPLAQQREERENAAEDDGESRVSRESGEHAAESESDSGDRSRATA